MMRWLLEQFTNDLGTTPDDALDGRCRQMVMIPEQQVNSPDLLFSCSRQVPALF